MLQCVVLRAHTVSQDVDIVCTTCKCANARLHPNGITPLLHVGRLTWTCSGYLRADNNDDLAPLLVARHMREVGEGWIEVLLLLRVEREELDRDTLRQRPCLVPTKVRRWGICMGGGGGGRLLQMKSMLLQPGKHGVNAVLLHAACKWRLATALSTLYSQ